MTKEQFEKLKPYEETIMNAFKRSFVHMPGTEFIKVAEIYAEIFGTPLTKSQMSCNTCRLNALVKYIIIRRFAGSMQGNTSS